MRPWKLLVCGLLLLPIGSLLAHPTPANGSKGKKLVYKGSIHMGDPPQQECTFSMPPAAFVQKLAA